jgi:hypothetical protein
MTGSYNYSPPRLLYRLAANHTLATVDVHPRFSFETSMET